MRSGLLYLLMACLVAVLLVTAGAGCRDGAAAATHGVRTIRVWCHQGQEGESEVMRQIAASFNAAHVENGWRVELAFFPDFQLTERTAIAAAAHDLPDAFEIDGPLVARCVDAGLLAPLDNVISREARADLIPTIVAQGTLHGKLYSIGAFDSSVVLYYDHELLARAGVEVPREGDGWTWPQFLDACARLREAGIEPLAMHLNESADEWFTYAFSPVIWSGGGRLISEDGRSVRGILASAENIASLRQWQQVFTRGYAATDPVDPNPFEGGNVALDWTGHWLARSHLKSKGNRLGAMPLPRLGAKTIAPCGSWCWALSSSARDPEVAAAWVRWVSSRDHGTIPIVRANGSVPAWRSAFAAFPEYETMPYRLFKLQAEEYARPRPHTPYYATLTQHFAAALRDIARGAEVETRLKLAEVEIQKVIDRRLRAKAPAARPGVDKTGPASHVSGRMP